MDYCRGRVRPRRDAALDATRRKGWFPLLAMQQRDALFSVEPFGQPQKTAACRVAAPCHSTTMSRRRALQAAVFWGCATPAIAHSTLCT